MSSNPPWYGWPPGGDTSDVTSVFTRTGAVVATAGDYKASQVTNDSSVAGATVKDALQNAAGGGAVASVFTRTGAVVATAGDYAASQVTNDSAVSGARVSNALNTLAAAITALVTGVSSVYGRAGAVVATAGDYAASQVTNDSAVSGARVSNALNTLATAITALVTGVSSVYGRAGAVVSAAGDYLASQVTNDSSVSGTRVSDALNTLKTSLDTITTFWTADLPPAAPSAFDDEFPNGAINARWSTWDVAGILTKSIDSYHLYLKATGNGADRWCGLYQAIPGSEFAVYTKFAMNADFGNFGECSLFVAENLATIPSTAKFRGVEFVVGSAINTMFTRQWSAYNGSASASSQNNGFLAVYARLRVNGTTVSSDYSLDGANWITLASVTATFTPVSFGLAIDITQNATTRGARFKFFRVFAGAGTSGFDATSIGGLL